MYNVVTRTIAEGNYYGVLTWTSYESKEEFDKSWIELQKKGWYEIVAEGVTQEQAVAYCTTPQARIRSMRAFFAEQGAVIARIMSTSD